MQMLIEIPEEVKQAFDCTESNDLKGSYYDHGGIIGNAIKNGTPLPKGHDRLLILDEGLVEKNMIPLSFSCQEWISEVGLSNSVVTIIPATKEGDI